MTILRNNGRAKFSIEEATKTLKSFGLSTSENVTRRLVREEKLKATLKGKNENDKRSGYVILEKDIYKYVVSQIPAMKEIFAKLEELERIDAPVRNKIKEIAK